MRAKVNGNSKNQTRSWFSKVIRKIDKFCAKGDRRAQLIKLKVKKKKNMESNNSCQQHL